MDWTRRSLLKSGMGVFGTATLAGCLSEFEGTENENQSGYAAFFALWDWAEQIGGEEFAFEDPVDVGELGGHGWEPGGDLARDVAGTDVFIYFDTPEYGWAQDIAAQLETDYDDVATIDAISGLESEMLPWSEEREVGSVPTADHDHDSGTTEVAQLEIVDSRTGEAIANFHHEHWHGELPQIPLDNRITVETVFEDGEGRVLPLGEEEPFQVNAMVREGAQEIVEIKLHDDEVELTGIEEGRTQLVFELLDDDGVRFDTSEDGIATEVDAEPADEDNEFYDPHIYSDPVRSQAIIDTIAEGLAEIDPDNREIYEENAASYNERLSEIDATLEALVAEAELDVAVLAGHESFRYIGEHYDFEIHTPMGISPGEEPSQEAIAETIEIVDEHGIDVILYDYFESPELAETIVENSDASEIEAISPLEGTTQEWSERGWGWIEHMEEVNIPAFEKALGAK
jgi:zinc transport system substrate-binding protein